MPTAGESAVAGSDATARPEQPDIRALRPHYPCLEGLRTIGVMALFFQHTGYTTGLQLRAGFAWMGHLELGPAMFFVLSAFLLYQPFATANLADRTAQRWRRFIKGRAFRVIPAYWVTLVLLILFFRADPSNPFSGGIKIDGWKDGLAVFLFAQTYFPKWFFHGIASAYTLNAEVVFYLLVPVYALVIRRWCRGKSLDEKLRREMYAAGRGRGRRSFAYRAFIEWHCQVDPQGVRRRVEREARVRGDAVVPRLRRLFRVGHGGRGARFVAARAGRRAALAPAHRRVRPTSCGWSRSCCSSSTAPWLGTHGLDYVGRPAPEARHLVNAADRAVPPAAGRVRRPDRAGRSAASSAGARSPTPAWCRTACTSGTRVSPTRR